MAKAKIIKSGLNYGMVVATSDEDKFYLVALFETEGEAREAKRKMYKNSQGIKYHIVKQNREIGTGKIRGWTIYIGKKTRRTF